MSEIPDVSPGEIIASDHINDIKDRSVQRYTDAGDRDTSNPTPDIGDLAYLEDNRQIQVFDGIEWLMGGGGTLVGQLVIRRSTANLFILENETNPSVDGGRVQLRTNDDGLHVRTGSPDGSTGFRVTHDIGVGAIRLYGVNDGSPFVGFDNGTGTGATHDFRFQLQTGQLRLQSSPKGTDTWTTLDTWVAP